MNKERELYFSKDRTKQIYKIITRHPDTIFYKAIKINRKYYKAKKCNNKIKMIVYGTIANKYARLYNLELYGQYGENLRIWHSNIIINGKAKLGNNINLHGNICIGANGRDDGAPIIEDNVDIGFGTVIIGNIKIAKNIKIGANSLVNKSFDKEGVTIAGCPARIIKNES